MSSEPAGLELAMATWHRVTRRATAMAPTAAPGDDPRWSGPRSDGRDPKRLAARMEQLFGARDWNEPVLVARLIREWASLVGEDVARWARPVDVRDGVVRIAVDAAAMATQLRLMSDLLVSRINEGMGVELARAVVIEGPSANRRSGAERAGGRHFSQW